jgi:enoyl-CoA hydratase/carnithine racemase
LARPAAESAVEAARAELHRIVKAIPRPTLEAYMTLQRRSLKDRLDTHLEQCLELQTALITAPDFLSRTERFAAKPVPAAAPSVQATSEEG